MTEKDHKAIIETIINTAALALTSYGVLQITTNGIVLQGYLALGIGVLLEFFKYYGRREKFW